jgi:hypothetical protein
MNVVISNRSKIGLGKVVVTKNNPIGKVNFSKVARVGSVALTDLTDVSTAGQKDGDVLVYHTDTSSYIIQTLPKLDGGFF